MTDPDLTDFNIKPDLTCGWAVCEPLWQANDQDDHDQRLTLIKSFNYMLNLPSEIINVIFYYSKEPNLIHVCRRFHNVLPSFSWYAKRLVALAFYDPIKNHVYSDIAIDLFSDFKLPGFQHLLSWEEQLALQAQICASDWFTSRHLILVKHEIMSKAIAEGSRLLELKPPAEGFETVIENALRSAEQDEDANLFIKLSWTFDGPFGTSGKISVLDNRLSFIFPTSIYNPWPWRMSPANLRTNILTLHALPVTLIEQVGQHDERAFHLLNSLLILRDQLNDVYSRRNVHYSIEACYTATEQAIENLLKGPLSSVDPHDKQLKLLLELSHSLKGAISNDDHFHNCELHGSAAPASGKPKSGSLSTHSMPRYFENVINVGDINAFRRMLQFKGTPYFPPFSAIRSMIRRARKNKVQNALQMLSEFERTRHTGQELRRRTKHKD